VEDNNRFLREQEELCEQLDVAKAAAAALTRQHSLELAALKSTLETTQAELLRTRSVAEQRQSAVATAIPAPASSPSTDAAAKFDQTMVATIEAGRKPCLSPEDFLSTRNDTDLLYWNVHGPQIATSLITLLNADAQANVHSLATRSAITRARIEAMLIAAFGFKPVWNDALTPRDRASLLPWLDELKRRCSTQRANRPAEPTPSGLGTLGALLEQAKRKG
jgi:hypothetical protein